MGQQEDLIKRGFAEAQQITRRFASTFYFASRLLRLEQRKASYAVYAMCRVSDESVDSVGIPARRDALARVSQNLDTAYSDTPCTQPLLACFRATARKYSIPKEYFTTLLNGMRQDLEKSRYASFAELYDYCYKVAGVIGLMMLAIFGSGTETARRRAVELGVAMQLTNIVRDIREDYLRGRIYLPEDEMKQFGVTEKDIADRRVTPAMIALLTFQMKRARDYYAASQPGIREINDRGSRLVITLMKELYATILDATEECGYDVFSRRVHVPFLRKTAIASSIILKGSYR